MARASGASVAQRGGDLLALGRVEHDDLRLVGQQAERPQRLLLVVGEAERGDELAVLERGLDPLDDGQLLLLRFPVGPGLLDAGLEPLDAVGDDAQVGEEHLLAEGRELGGRVAAGEAAEDDQEGVALADQGQPLGVVAVRAGHEARACRGTRRWPA